MVNLKETVKRCVPAGLWYQARNLVKLQLGHYMQACAQAARFNRHYAREYPQADKQLEARISFFTHQLEKGLSHRKIRLGFGKNALRQLTRHLKRYRVYNLGYLHVPICQSAFATLVAYWEEHNADAAAKAQFEAILGPELLADLRRFRAGGDSLVQRSVEPGHHQRTLGPASSVKSTLVQGSEEPASPESGQRSIDFAPEKTLAGGGALCLQKAERDPSLRAAWQKLNRQRHSVREFADSPLDPAALNAALAEAGHTPSVCNRQANRIHLIEDEKLIQQALQIQGGLGGYDTPPALLLVTSDLRTFFGPEERNQPYVDGGLFAMNLLMSLEANEIAACPLNTMMQPYREKATRQLLNLPDHEVMIMYIAIGNFAEEYKACVSYRHPLAENLTIH